MSRRWRVPEVLQTSATDCGPACLAAALQGLGIPASYGWLRDACATGADGTSVDDLEVLATRLGADAQQVLEPVDHVTRPEAQALPAIVVIVQPSGDNHFIVVWRRVGAWVQVMDPGVGVRWWTTAYLQRVAYRHTAVLPDDAVADWVGGDGFVEPLRARAREVSGSSASLDAAIARRRDGSGWSALAALDAAVRFVDELVRGGALRRGRAAAALVEELAARADIDPTSIPAAFWTIQPAPELGSARVRGAILLRLGPGAGPAVAAPAGGHERQRPWNALWALSAGVRPPARLALLGLAVVASAVAADAVLLRGFLALAPRLEGAGQLAGAIAALVVVMAVLVAIEALTFARVKTIGRAVEGAARIALERALARLPLAYLRSRPTSDLIERAHQLHRLRELPMAAARLGRAGLELLICGAVLALLVPARAWVVALAVAAVAAIAALSYGPLTRLDLRLQTYAGAMSRFFFDAMRGLMPVRAHGVEGALRSGHEQLVTDWTRAGLAAGRVAVVAELALMLVAGGAAAFIVGALPGEHAAAPLAAFWALTFAMLGLQVLGALREVPAHRSLSLRLLEPLQAHPPEPRAPALPPPSGPVELELAQVSVVVSGRAILRDTSLRIAAGEHVAIVGSSGAGKSTLLGLLLGWVEPAAGEVRVDGQPLAAALEGLRARTAWVDEGAYLWNRSVRDNVVLDEGAAAVDDAAVDAELLPVIGARAEGLGFEVGEGGARFSGGEGQRLRLARAFARPAPALVLLDEPFRGLSRDVRRRLLARARARWAGVTLLFVTHDLAETVDLPRVLVVEDGAVIEDGAPGELLRAPGSRYAALVASHVAASRMPPHWRRLRLEHGRLTDAVEDAP